MVLEESAVASSFSTWDGAWLEKLFDLRSCLTWEGAWLERPFDFKDCLASKLFDLNSRLTWNALSDNCKQWYQCLLLKHVVLKEWEKQKPKENPKDFIYVERSHVIHYVVEDSYTLRLAMLGWSCNDRNLCALSSVSKKYSTILNYLWVP